MSFNMNFSESELASIKKSLVNFFKRVGDGKANNTEVAMLPHILNTLVSDGRINLSYHSNINAEEKQS